MASNPFEDPSVADASNTGANAATLPSWAAPAPAPAPAPQPSAVADPPAAPSWAASPPTQQSSNGSSGGGRSNDSSAVGGYGRGGGRLTDGEVSKVFKGVRLLNIVFSGLFIAAAFLAYANGNVSSGADFFATVYAVVFGSLLACYELGVNRYAERIQRNFGFMGKSWGRAMFMLFIGTIPLNLGDMGLASGILMLLNAFGNLFMICKYGSPHASQREAVTPAAR